MPGIKMRAFFPALKAELMDYRDELEFKREYNLTRKPLQMVIIGKNWENCKWLNALRELMAPEIAEEKQMAAELGKKIGNEQRAKIVARNMFNRGYSAEDASGMTEFDQEQIKTWYQEWEKH